MEAVCFPEEREARTPGKNPSKQRGRMPADPESPKTPSVRNLL